MKSKAQRFPMTAGPDASAMDGLVETRQPFRQPGLEADVLVPAWQAVLLGITGGLSLAGVLATLSPAPFWQTAGVCVAGGIALTFWWRLGVVTSTLWTVETYESAEDTQVEKPVDQAHIMALSPYAGQVAQQNDELNRLRGAFVGFVLGCAVDTSARRWERKVGRERYQEWRSLLLSSGYAAWRGNDPKSGWELTTQPEQIIKQLGPVAAEKAARQ